MSELKYTWRINADDETEALLKMRALTMLSNKLKAKDIELLSNSKCLSYFIQSASLESGANEVVLPLTPSEEKAIIRRRKFVRIIRKLLPFLGSSQKAGNAQIKSL